MKNISIWAARHVFFSRTVIVISHTLLLFISVALSLLLFLEDTEISKIVMVILAHLIVLGIITYPKKKEKNNWISWNFIRQKFLDISLIISGCMLVIASCTNLMNRLVSNDTNHTAFSPAFIVHRSSTSITTPSNTTSKRQFLKSIRSKVKTELILLKKQYKAQGNKKASKGVKVLLILLTLGIAVLLAVTIAFLGCSVYCTASPVLGVAVWIIGWGGLIWLTIAMIKRIIKGKRSDVRSQ